MLDDGKSDAQQDGRRNDTRARLLEEALQLLVSRGYEHATTGRIAAAAGIGQSSFYSHFASREACLAEAVAQEANALIVRLAARRRAIGPRASRTLVTREAVRAGFVLALHHLSQHAALVALIGMREADHAAGAAVREALERLRDELVGDLSRFGVTAPADAPMRIELLMALTFQAADGIRAARYTAAAVVEVLTDQAIALLQP
ncbi:MAG: TetR/AcrR family transcriptional regulator [Myxococcales bacterium]|nr:TetR/AcrR family transcriptional regulator [Myxococcales bacterium]MCB9628984.1 TetR/AcrR family transcriptional regulator [Sandaracinaceae bacterium]